MDFQEFQEVSVSVNKHQKKELHEVHTFHCQLCNTRMECSLMQFREHISESHRKDNLEGTMVNWQGLFKDRGQNFLSIDNMLIQIKPELTKP